MPPRLPPQSVLACCVELSSFSGSSSGSSAVVASPSPLERALLSSQFQSLSSSCRSFSSSTNRQRRNAPLSKQWMQNWYKKQGKVFKTHTPGQPNYLGSNSSSGPLRPFPSNPAFISQPVLSEEAREMIWNKVIVRWEGIKAVSAELGVDQRRVAAVVRMKEIEREWAAKGLKLAKPYSRAVLEMVPTHSYPKDKAIQALEPINEIHVHGYTMQQLFVPTSESRHFTRKDAAKAFHHTMLSPDERVPHPELVEMERRVKDGIKEKESWDLFKREAKESEDDVDGKVLLRAEKEKKSTTTVSTGRFEFRIKSISVDDVGKDGRARGGVGWRYGIPSEDRKKNQVKIPTKID